ncbi:MAG: co-chaperone GroES, partial [Neisseria sp.]
MSIKQLFLLFYRSTHMTIRPLHDRVVVKR